MHVISVLSRRPRGTSHYAILSSEGVTQVWAEQVTFTSMDDFRREVTLYKRLTKVGSRDSQVHCFVTFMISVL